MEKCLNVAKTMFDQLRWSVDISTIMSWGISRSLAINYENMHTLALLVNGVRHKGWVYISYNEGLDLYDVRLLNKQKDKVIKLVENIYADMLGSTIDRLVEYDPTDTSKEKYKEQIKKEYDLN